jgi:hypothetical protein
MENLVYVSDSEEEEPGVLIEEDSETSETSLSEEIKDISLEEIKSKRYIRLEEGYKTNTPVKYIFLQEGRLINVRREMEGSRDIISSYKDLLTRGLKINARDFLVVYLISNPSISSEKMVEDFNSFSEFSKSDTVYYQENFEEYKNQFESIYKNFFQSTEKEFKTLNESIELLSKIKIEQDLDKIFSSVTVRNTQVEYKILDSGYPVGSDVSEILFDEVEVNKLFPFVSVYKGGKYKHKVLNNLDNYDRILEISDGVEREENTVLIVYETVYRNKPYNNYVEIKLDRSTIVINHPEKKLEFLMNSITNLMPSITFESELEKRVSASFRLDIENYEEFKMYYLILFDPFFTNYLFIREVSNLRSFKENLKFYYRDYDCNREELSYISYFNIKKFFEKTYTIDFTSKSLTAMEIKRFMLTLIKLLRKYEQTGSEKMKYYSFIKTPYTGPEGSGLGGSYIPNLESGISTKNKKIDDLYLKNPELFSKNLYSRNCNCPKQPIIISEKDVDAWSNYEYNGKKRNVLLFPPQESTHDVPKMYYVCPDDEFSNLGFKENPDPNSEYPLVPCCNLGKAKQDLYKDYDTIRTDKEYFFLKDRYKGKEKNVLKTFKILASDRLGRVPGKLKEFFQGFSDNEYLREGTSKISMSTFVHSVTRASLDLLGKVNFENQKKNTILGKIFAAIKDYPRSKTSGRERIVSNLRKTILNPILVNIEVGFQENFDLNMEELRRIILDVRYTNLESDRFYRVFEQIFGVNIFIFEYDRNSGDVNLETPNFQYYHDREVREELPCFLIMKHLQEGKTSIYENIRGEEKNKDFDSYYIFGSDYTKFIMNRIRSDSYYIVDLGVRDTKSVIPVVRKNNYVNVNWNKILKDYKIVRQLINSSGRSFSMTIQISPDPEDLMTLFIKPSHPFDAPAKPSISLTTKSKCQRTMGEGEIGSGGIFYEMNGVKDSVFVPCSDIPVDETKRVSSNYEVILKEKEKTKILDRIKFSRKNAKTVRQLIFWVFLKEDIGLEDWFQKYVEIDDSMNPEILSSRIFDPPKRLPDTGSDCSSAIEYLREFIPEIFGTKISMYPEFHRAMLRHMKNVMEKTRGLEMVSKNFLSQNYEGLEDYKKYPFNKILIGSKEYQLWRSSIKSKSDNFATIEDEDILLERVFTYINADNEKIYFISNNSGNDLLKSIYSCYFWRISGGVLGYETEPWLLLSDEKTMGELGWSEKSLRTFVEERVLKRVYFKTVPEYLKFISINRIPFESRKDFSYIVYSRVGQKIEVVSEYIVDDVTPFEIFMYPEGGYAAMLPLI